MERAELFRVSSVLGLWGFQRLPPPSQAPPEPFHSKIRRAIRQRSQALAREGLASPQVHPHWHAAWNFLLRQGPGAWMQISVIVSIRLYGGPRHLLIILQFMWCIIIEMVRTPHLFIQFGKPGMGAFILVAVYDGARGY